MNLGRFNKETENFIFDFARCQRGDGSYYGIKDGTTCRKGKPVSDKQLETLKAAAKQGNKKAQLALDVVNNKKTKEQAAQELKKGGGDSSDAVKPSKPQKGKLSPAEEAKAWADNMRNNEKAKLEAQKKEAQALAAEMLAKAEAGNKKPKLSPAEEAKAWADNMRNNEKAKLEAQKKEAQALAAEMLAKAEAGNKKPKLSPAEEAKAAVAEMLAKEAKEAKESKKKLSPAEEAKAMVAEMLAKEAAQNAKANEVKKPSSKKETEAKIRDWANNMPPSMFKDDAAKEKFIKDKTREALKKERIGDGSAIRNAQRERLKRDFAPVDGKLKFVGGDGKSDTKTADNINKGLDALRKTSPDAAAKVDAMMKALEKNPVALISKDPESGPLTGRAKASASAAAGMNGADGQAYLTRLASKKDTGREMGFASMQEGVIVMTGGKDLPGRIRTQAEANKALKAAANGKPTDWGWGGGGSATFVHETGHIMHKRAFPGKSQQQIAKETEAEFAKLGIKSPSKYGNTNVFETTAELYAAYVSNGPQLKKNMPQAYEWIDNMAQRAYNYEPV